MKLQESGWADNNKKRGHKVLRIARTDCPSSPKVELHIAPKDGRAQCIEGRVADATAIDTDLPPNTLTFELVSGPTGFTVSPTGWISWTPIEAQGPGTYAVAVRVFGG